jgi:glycosyltransferase involved in cell wall biosynthesis
MSQETEARDGYERRRTDRRQGERSRTGQRVQAVEIESRDHSDRRLNDVHVTVILPTYNEEPALAKVLASLLTVLDEESEVIVIDDGSTDDTATIASAFPCRLIRHVQNYGKGAAVRTGLLHARGRFIIVMDADGSYPTDIIPQMVSLGEQHDFVRCVRQNGKVYNPPLNRVGNVLFNALLKVVYGLQGADHLSGMYGLRREALEALKFSSDRFDLEVEIGIKARAYRLRSITLPITYAARIGDKKLRPWRDGWVILRRLLSLGLVYSPGIMFVVPGLLIVLLSAFLVIVLSQGSIDVPYAVRLDIHSFIVAALGTTIGFQVLVFGIVAALYGTELGAPPKQWLRLLADGRTRYGAAGIGIICCLIGAVQFTTESTSWLASAHRTFGDTRALVLSVLLVTWGVQVILAAMFVSIFAGRLDVKPSVHKIYQAESALSDDPSAIDVSEAVFAVDMSAESDNPALQLPMHDTSAARGGIVKIPLH